MDEGERGRREPARRHAGRPGAPGAQAATGNLPRTGSFVTDLLPLAVVLVLAGIATLGLRSRSRRRMAA